MKKNYKQYKLIVNFLFLLVFTLTFVSFIIDFGVKKVWDEQTGKVNQVMNHEIDPEIVIFGSSVSEVGIDPRIVTTYTNKSCYNLSINGTRFSQYKCLINEFNSYTVNNEIVVLVETFFSFEPVDRITSLEYYLTHIKNDNIYYALDNIDNNLIWKTRYVPFYKFIPANHIYYKNAIKGWANFLNIIPKKDTLFGYTPVCRNWEKDADDAIKNTKKFEINIQKEIVDDYQKNIIALQKRGKKVVIVLTPMYAEKFKLVTDINPLIKKLKNISAKTTAKFIDFSTSKICTSKSNFYNSNHLNYRGSKLFSRQLSDSLNYYLKQSTKKK